jgi:hypothetical protein
MVNNEIFNLIYIYILYSIYNTLPYWDYIGITFGLDQWTFPSSDRTWRAEMLKGVLE